MKFAISKTMASPVFAPAVFTEQFSQLNKWLKDLADYDRLVALHTLTQNLPTRHALFLSSVLQLSAEKGSIPVEPSIEQANNAEYIATLVDRVGDPEIATAMLCDGLFLLRPENFITAEQYYKQIFRIVGYTTEGKSQKHKENMRKLLGIAILHSAFSAKSKAAFGRMQAKQITDPVSDAAWNMAGSVWNTDSRMEAAVTPKTPFALEGGGNTWAQSPIPRGWTASPAVPSQIWSAPPPKASPVNVIAMQKGNTWAMPVARRVDQSISLPAGSSWDNLTSLQGNDNYLHVKERERSYSDLSQRASSPLPLVQPRSPGPMSSGSQTAFHPLATTPPSASTISLGYSGSAPTTPLHMMAGPSTPNNQSRSAFGVMDFSPLIEPSSSQRSSYQRQINRVSVSDEGLGDELADEYQAENDALNDTGVCFLIHFHCITLARCRRFLHLYFLAVRFHDSSAMQTRLFAQLLGIFYTYICFTIFRI
eukprot:Colp12_sorted_trinity150504_noHs@831